MKYSSGFVGFLQAAGVVLYVTVFAAIASNLQTWAVLRNAVVPPFLAILLFLLTFVVSALICGSLVLGYPAYLFFNGNKKEAVRLVLWSVLWLLGILAVFLAATFR